MEMQWTTTASSATALRPPVWSLAWPAADPQPHLFLAKQDWQPTGFDSPALPQNPIPIQPG
jgi:hypothetical protein